VVGAWLAHTVANRLVLPYQNGFVKFSAVQAIVLLGIENGEEM
jgi:hypothetical protein